MSKSGDIKKFIEENLITGLKEKKIESFYIYKPDEELYFPVSNKYYKIEDTEQFKTYKLDLTDEVLIINNKHLITLDKILEIKINPLSSWGN